MLHASALGILYQAATFVTTFGYVPPWAHDGGMSAGDLGLLTAAALVPSAIMSMVVGSSLGRRWRLERTLLFAFLDVAVCTATIPLQGHGAWLFVGQGLSGLGRGLATPGLMTLAVRSTPPARRAASLALYQSLYAIDMIGGPALASLGVEGLGLGPIFVLAGLVSFGAAGYTALARLGRISAPAVFDGAQKTIEGPS